LRKALKIIIN